MLEAPDGDRFIPWVGENLFDELRRARGVGLSDRPTGETARGEGDWGVWAESVGEGGAATASGGGGCPDIDTLRLRRKDEEDWGGSGDRRSVSVHSEPSASGLSSSKDSAIASSMRCSTCLVSGPVLLKSNERDLNIFEIRLLPELER